MRLASPTSRANFRFRLLPIDVLWAGAAPFLALWLRDPGLLNWANFPFDVPETYQFAAISFVCAMGAFLFFRLSDGVTRFFSVQDALFISGAVASAVAASSLLCFTITRLDGVPRSTPFIYALVLGGTLIFSRVVARLFYREGPKHRMRPKRQEVRRVMLLGVDRFAAAAIRLTDCQSPRTTVVVAALDSALSSAGRKVCGVRIVGAAQDLDEILDEYAVHGVSVDEIWQSDSAQLPPEIASQVRAVCEARDLPLLLVSEAFGLLPPAPQQSDRSMQASRDIEINDYFESKRVLDILISTILLAALLPVAAIVALLVLADVGAPVLFWQQRLGRNGRKFLLYKFRTYHAPFDRAGNRLEEEQRLSSIGRAIRATRMDEIPQLYNVLIGDMSMVGPRPLLPHDQPSDPRSRLLVRPGITGWAQINGGRIIGPEEKDALDIWYIRHASFALDIEILINTVLFAVTGEKMNHSVVEDAIRWREAERSDDVPIPPPVPPLRYASVRRRESFLARQTRPTLESRSAGES